MIGAPAMRKGYVAILAGTVFLVCGSPVALAVVPVPDSGSESTPAMAMPCQPQGRGAELMSVDTPRSGAERENVALGCGINSIVIGGRLNVSAFTIPKGPSRYAPGMRYSIQRDYSGHGGGYWKLFDRGTRIGTYKKDGWPRNAQP